MVDRVLDVPVLLEPERSSGMQPGNGVGIGGLELAPQDVREEMVVPVFGPGRVEGDEEEVRALDLGEHRGGVGALEHDVAEGRRQSLEHRRVHHEVSDAGICRSQDIAGEVVEDVARVTRELMDEAPRVRLLLEDDRGQTESREPALGPLGELPDVTGREPNVGLSKERVGLGGRDAEIPCSELRQVAVGAEPGDRQAGVVAARDDDLDCAGGAIHEHADRLVAGTARHGVPVLEHEDDRRAVRELVDEERKPRLGDRSRPCGERHE